MIVDSLRYMNLEELSRTERNALVARLKQHRRDLARAIREIDKKLEGAPKRRRSKKAAK